MAEQPEMIQRELDETRSALAEKLEQIGGKISGTVETVTDTVAGVTETVSNVTEVVEGTVQNVAQAVSGTVESVKETVETVGEKAGETVEAVKRAFNLSEQVQNHPWLWFGGSVVAGFVGGKLLAPRRRRHTPEAESFTRGYGYYERPEGTEWAASAGNGHHEADTSRAEETARSEPKASWLSGLFEHFGGEINKLKGLALGTMFGVVRDMVSEAVPEGLKEQLVDVINDVTRKAGGETIEGPVLGESSHQESDSPGGAAHDHSNPTAMDRPMGTAERKGKAAMGQSHG